MLRVDLTLLRKREWCVMVVNNTHELIPNAQAMYACDLQWWERYESATRAFRGSKWTSDKQAARRYALHHINRSSGNGLCTERNCIYSGGNGGYQAINLVYHLGAKKIVLLGFDMHRNEGGHWHGEHEGMISAPDSHVRGWVPAFDALAHDLRALGVSVVNATPGSALQCFPRSELRDCL